MSAATPGVLDPEERRSVEERFGVGEAQVMRDHVISHVLAAIASGDEDDVVFFGGTALSRTYLPDLRLSEDVDLISRGDRGRVGDRIERAIATRLARVIGRPTFSPSIRATSHPNPSIMEAGGARVRIQLLPSIGYPPWPTEVVDIEQRYSDAPPARMRVLTPAAFAAAKLSAWADREAPRDLYDMWALARSGMIDGEAAELFGAYGAFTSARQVSFEKSPTRRRWHVELAHQCIPQVGPEEAARVVREAWEQAERGSTGSGG